MNQSVTVRRTLAAGAVAGVISVTVFTVLHQIFTSSIWWMFPIMAVAGGVSGLTLSWGYSTLVSTPTHGSWWVYIGMMNIMFGLLALVSVLIYEPIITMAEVISSPGGNPIPISETLALMVVFTVLWSTLLTVLFRGGWSGFFSALVTVSVLMLLLGFNLSTVGLVEVPTEGWILLGGFFGYVTALSVTYGLTYIGLLRVSRRASAQPEESERPKSAAG